MRIVIFLKRLDAYRNHLPESAREISPVREKGELGIYQFSNDLNQLDIVEMGEQNSVDIHYRHKTLVFNVPYFAGFDILIDQTPCFIVVNHWGRGVSFRYNNKSPELKVLQVGFNGKWKVLSRNPCIVVTSGGFDPISDLIACFFEHRGKNARVLQEIETRMLKGIRK